MLDEAERFRILKEKNMSMLEADRDKKVKELLDFKQERMIEYTNKQAEVNGLNVEQTRLRNKVEELNRELQSKNQLLELSNR